MGVPVSDVVRWKEKDTVAAAAITPESPDAAILDALVTHPVLLNRPIVRTPKGVKLCRPSETVADLT